MAEARGCACLFGVPVAWRVDGDVGGDATSGRFESGRLVMIMRATKERVVELALHELEAWEPGHQRLYWEAVGDPRSEGPVLEAKAGLKNWSWCVAFVSWIYASAGHPLTLWGGIAGMAYVPFLYEWGRAHGVLRGAEYQPDAGDIVIYGRLSDSGPCHTGIVVSDCESIEGNYSNRVERVVFREQKDPVIGFLAVLPHEPEMNAD